MPEMSRLGRLYAVVLVLTLTSVPAWADLRLLLGGQAHDVTTAEDHTLSLDLVLAEEGASVASGRFDGPHLSGEFRTEGGPLTPCRRGHVCLSFQGVLRTGDGVAPCTLAVELEPGLVRARGVYHIAAAGTGGGARWGSFTAQSRAE